MLDKYVLCIYNIYIICIQGDGLYGNNKYQR